MCWLIWFIGSLSHGVGGEIEQTENVDQHNRGEELGKQSLDTSVFVNSEPLREAQIHNAVKFLSHLKVRGSPVTHRRSFLEKKGLMKEEIDEAFRRVPVSILFDLLPNFLYSSIACSYMNTTI